MRNSRPHGTLYTSDFYAGQVEGSARSAKLVVPLLLSLVPAKSVVELGCGVGPWAAEFMANGVEDVWGIDGEYVDRSQLRIPLDRFIAHDLVKPLQLKRTFDLAVCLEVAEHLPESRANGLVADLCGAAPCVLFSAALPCGGGTGHVNEQYLPYWVERFQHHGYEGIDAIRPKILGNNAVEWWYQQNTVVFVAPNHPLLSKGFLKPQTIIHPDLYEQYRHPNLGLKTIARALPGAIIRSLKARLRR